MNSIRFLLGFALVAAAAPAPLARAQSVTLEALETAVVSENPRLQRSEADVRAAETRIDAARAEMLPSLYADVGVSGAPGGRVVEIPDPSSSSGSIYVSGTRALDQSGALEPIFRYSAGLRFDGPLYDFGRTSARMDAARADARVAAASTDTESEALVRDVRAAYVRWLAAYESRRIVEASVAIAETRARQTADAVAAGVRPGADREIAAYEVTRLRLQLARSAADEEDARANVARTARVELDPSATPDATWLEPADADARLPTPAAIAALELRREALGASLRAYDRRFRPVLGISVRLGVSAQQVSSDEGDRLAAFPAYSIQVGLSMPLWDPRLGSHLRREAEAREESLSAAEAELRSAVEAEHDRARVAFERASEQLAIATEGVRLAETIAANAEERYRVNGGSIDTVVTARQREISARADRLSTEVALASARMRLRPMP